MSKAPSSLTFCIRMVIRDYPWRSIRDHLTKTSHLHQEQGFIYIPVVINSDWGTMLNCTVYFSLSRLSQACCIRGAVCLSVRPLWSWVSYKFDKGPLSRGSPLNYLVKTQFGKTKQNTNDQSHMISVKSDPNTALFPTPSTAAILLWSDLTGEGGVNHRARI